MNWPELNPEQIPAILRVLHGVFLGLLAWILFRSWRVGRKTKQPGKKTGHAAYSLTLMVILGLLAAVFVYQATWQLTGFARPQFVSFMQTYNRRPYNPAENLHLGAILDRNGLPLAYTAPAADNRRVYPLGPAAAQVVGYAHPRFGRAGIESTEQAVLNGSAMSTGDARKQFGRNVLDRSAIHGGDVRTTLDARLQQAAFDALKGRKGSVVMLDPSTGQVLALVSSPSFDPNDLSPATFNERLQHDSPLLNRALMGLYPPGSIVKPLMAALALDQKQSPVFDCPGEGITAGSGNQPIRDSQYYAYKRQGRVWPGHGRIGLREAVVKSSNVYFAQLGMLLGPDVLNQAALEWRIGQRWILRKSSVGAPLQTVAGNFPALKSGQLAKIAQVSFGQGELLVTPFHMAMAMSALAGKGVCWEPSLLMDEPARPLNPWFGADSANAVIGMMRDVVRSGTATAADVPGLSVAGKTGTAQNPSGKDHSWFVCMAPAEQARIVLVVLVEEGGYGSQAALPVAVSLLKQAKNLGYIRSAGGG